MLRLFFAVVTFALYLPLCTTAAPVECPATGHWYEVIQDEVSWTDAKAAADASIHLGSPGHLVTITSQAEQGWLEDYLLDQAPDNHVHVGGVQDLDGTEPGGGWGWDTGEPMVYTNWYPGEPNEYRGNSEDTMFIFAGGSLEGGQWADGQENSPRWYVVEYDIQPVPVRQATWGLIKTLAP